MSEADENPYLDLSDDNDLAFLQLEAEFRDEFERAVDEPNEHWGYFSQSYMNKVVAAATALDIDALSGRTIPSQSHSNFGEIFSAFQTDVDNVIIQMRILNARRVKRLSVGFTSDQKTKIRALIEKIRDDVENSDASSEKKHRVFGMLSALEAEISRDRARFEYFGDLARGLASVSRDIEETGARPWWKWFAAVMGIVDDQKESEPKALPSPRRKQIEPPKKQIEDQSAKRESGGFDDEIPF